MFTESDVLDAVMLIQAGIITIVNIVNADFKAAVQNRLDEH